MDYKEIKEKYPKAWAAFVNWGFTKSFFSDLLFGDINKFEETIMSNSKPNRELYDFFDGSRLFVVPTLGSEVFDFGFSIMNGNREYIYCNYAFYNTREKAEEAAFIKAFEILEEKL